jgi:hypothetical protein
LEQLLQLLLAMPHRPRGAGRPDDDEPFTAHLLSGRSTIANDDLRTQKLERRVKRFALDHTQKYLHTAFALPGKIMVNPTGD